ncbi:VOC family protein [Gemmata massiliana]|uniref:VOC family protein n=1 Tax=Gemmata massiliana TaxID=1210884 RepID=UPI0021BCF590|nr:VOC family protein [Gemmata massiliana]
MCLWYSDDAKTAAQFYAKTFPRFVRQSRTPHPRDYPAGKKGDVLTEFIVIGIPCPKLGWNCVQTHGSVLIPGRNH